METPVLYDCDLYQLTLCFPLSFVLGQPGVPEEYHTYPPPPPPPGGGECLWVSACLMLPHHISGTVCLLFFTPPPTLKFKVPSTPFLHFWNNPLTSFPTKISSDTELHYTEVKDLSSAKNLFNGFVVPSAMRREDSLKWPPTSCIVWVLRATVHFIISL